MQIKFFSLALIATLLSSASARSVYNEKSVDDIQNTVTTNHDSLFAKVINRRGNDVSYNFKDTKKVILTKRGVSRRDDKFVVGGPSHPSPIGNDYKKPGAEEMSKIIPDLLYKELTQPRY